MVATGAGVVALVIAIVLAGFGVLLWVAIPTSDSATSSLFLVGLALVAAGSGFALLGWFLLRALRSRAPR